MKIEVKVIPGARRNAILPQGTQGTGLKVYLTAPAADGKANKALVEILADHYRVRKQQIEIIKGLKSRHKIIIISDI
ncbi:MAG: DUF167 domain-containing protein [Candidatus Omnitrophica bacterium]|nr:DUF167 domain-containing protein [Candidatus Omnitrophota bacterium]